MPLHSYGVKLNEIVTALTSLGMSRYEALLFAVLCGSEAATAGELSAETGVNRMQAYRSLQRLEKRGLVHMVLVRPRRYSVISPAEAVENILSENAERLRDAEAVMRKFIASLPRKKEKMERNLLRIIGSRSSIYKEMKRMIDRSREEVLVFTTGKGLLRAYQKGVNEVLLHAIHRGVRCRMIADINVRNFSLMTAVSKYIPLKHLERQRARFIIFDRSAMVAFLIQDENSVKGKAETALVTDSADFVNAHLLFFEHAWSTAQTSESRFAELQKPRP
ncbi:MAG: helix-turn-helix domain-containing protein [Methanomassiliicoccales archaeon]